MRLPRLFKPRPVPVNTREILALERTRLANERTFMAYIRSSLYLLIGGIALLQLKDYPELHWVGYFSLIVCVIFMTIGVGRFLYLRQKLSKWKEILGKEVLEQQIDAEINADK